MIQNERNDVLCIGSLGVDAKPFEERELIFKRVELDKINKLLNKARAIIIAEPPYKIDVVQSCILKLKTKVEEYGLAFFVVVASSADQKKILKIWKDQHLECPDERIYNTGNVGKMAQKIYEYNPGPPCEKIKIISPGFKILPEIKWLLSRAFYDCEKVHLKKLEGGKRSDGVFCVEAFLKNRMAIIGPRPGPRLVPFFIKIVKTEDWQEEINNYKFQVKDFVPFYLRPNLDHKRCFKTKKYSTIVGNFIEDAQSLRSVLRYNPGSGIIFSLFENSLRGFRLQPSETSSVNENLCDFIKSRTKAKDILPKVINKAKKLGLKSHPKQLEKSLLASIKDFECKFGSYHGDLHSGNVMVRGKDAILIDFKNIDIGPFTADPAAIEVSLVFGIDKNDKYSEQESWIKFVDEIYQLKLDLNPPQAENIPSAHSWLRKAVREIRHITLGCDGKINEKLAVLIAYLIRFARLDIEDFKNRKLTTEMATERHAYALVIAERLVKLLKSIK